MNNLKLDSFYSALKSQSLYRSSIASEAVPSLPVPILKSKELFAGVLLLRTKKEGKGRIQIFRPEGSLVAGYPEPRIAKFHNFLVLDPYDDINASEPVDTFPSKAIANWPISRYREVRSQYFEGFPAFRMYMLTKGKEAKEETQAMIQTFLTVTEPGLLPFYADLSPLFTALCVKARPEIKENIRKRATPSAGKVETGRASRDPDADDEDDALAGVSRAVREGTKK